MTDEERAQRRAAPLEWLARLPGGSIAKSSIETAERMVDQVPALAWFRSRVGEVEQSALQSLRDRLWQLEGGNPVGAFSPNSASSAPAEAAAAQDPTPAEAFARLLETAETQTPTEARGAAMLRMIREMVPDEARIILALADGSEYAVLQAHDGNDHIVKNRSNVGRNARIHSQELTSSYVTHLLELGLVELAPYTGSDIFEYELIEAETEVREILGHYDHRKLMKPKIERQVIRLSEAGRRFCEVCLPS